MISATASIISVHLCFGIRMDSPAATISEVVGLPFPITDVACSPW